MILFLPVVLAYTAFIYRVLRGKVTERAVEADHFRATERGNGTMWYFSWVLGLGLACAFAILNAMWLEVRADDDHRR